MQINKEHRPVHFLLYTIKERTIYLNRSTGNRPSRLPANLWTDWLSPIERKETCVFAACGHLRKRGFGRKRVDGCTWPNQLTGTNLCGVTSDASSPLQGITFQFQSTGRKRHRSSFEGGFRGRLWILFWVLCGFLITIEFIAVEGLWTWYDCWPFPPERRSLLSRSLPHLSN